MGDINIKFPIGGIHEGAPFTEQPPLTTSDALNVTGQDPVSGRSRGAQRAGFSKFNSETPPAAGKISLVSGVSYDATPSLVSALASGSEITEWEKKLGSGETAWCIATDLENSAYVITSGNLIAKYNQSGYKIFSYRVESEDDVLSAQEFRSISVGDDGIIYVGSSTGGSPSDSQIIAVEVLSVNDTYSFNKIWKYKPGGFVKKLVATNGRVYACVENTSTSIAKVICLAAVSTAVPVLEKSKIITYPVNDIDISEDSLSLYFTSPASSSRSSEPLNPGITKTTSYVDWTPYNLEGYEDRIWSWLDSTDVDGDGTGNSAYEDFEEVTYWTDKSGNGRDAFVNPAAGYYGPQLSKSSFNGLDCLAFSASDALGNTTDNRYLTSSSNQAPQPGGAFASNNKGLVPTHYGASFAFFIVVEFDESRVQYPFAQPYNRGFSNTGVALADQKGLWAVSCNQVHAPNGNVSGPNTATTLDQGYTKKAITVSNSGQGEWVPAIGGTTGSTFGDFLASGDEATQGGWYTGSAATGEGFHYMLPNGGSQENRAVISFIVRTKSLSNAVITEPLLEGKAAVESAGYATTSASHFRVNGQLCSTFQAPIIASVIPAVIGRLPKGADFGSSPNLTNTNVKAFKGKVCEIIVLKEWYYQADPVSSPQRLNVCSSRPPRWTTADHGEYSPEGYHVAVGDDAASTSLAGESQLSGRIYESELMEGYLAHKWGLSHLLPNGLAGRIVINDSAAMPNGSTLFVPTIGGSTRLYTFVNTTTGTAGASNILISTAAAGYARILDQAKNIVNAINSSSDAPVSTSQNDYVYAMPPRIWSPFAASGSNKYAIIELRTKSSMAYSDSSVGTANGFTSPINSASAPTQITSLSMYDSSYTNTTAYNRFSGRSKFTAASTIQLGTCFSVHPFATARYQVHANSYTPASWTVKNYGVARTLGGAPVKTGRRSFQPGQAFASNSAVVSKINLSTMRVEWMAYNDNPNGVTSGSPFVAYGGIGTSVACGLDTDGTQSIFCTGPRITSASYPAWTEAGRIGVSFPSSSDDASRFDDLGKSFSKIWSVQLSESNGLGEPVYWTRSSCDEFGNFIVPLSDMSSQSAESLAVLRPSDGVVLHRYALSGASDSRQQGLCAAPSYGTLSLPSGFSDKRCEFIYLGTATSSSLTITFAAGSITAGSSISISGFPQNYVYTFVSSPGSTAFNVGLGGSLSGAIQNLANAINKSTPTTGYGTLTTLNKTVRAINVTGTSITLRAVYPAESSANPSFSVSSSSIPGISIGSLQYSDNSFRLVKLLSVGATGTVESFRSTRNIAVYSNGRIYSVSKTGAPAVASGYYFEDPDAQYFDSAVLYEKVYITNGFTVAEYDPVTNSSSKLEATTGGLETIRWAFAASWRGRLVLARNISSPHNWAMSAVGDPNNFDYFPDVVNPAQAIKGTISRAGLVPDVINTIIPYNDDLLIFGGDHSIYRLTGDPMSNGQLDLVTDVVGMSYGKPWDKDPEGTLYFMSSRGALYAWPIGKKITELSKGRFEQRLASFDLSQSFVKLVWNDQDRCLHIFMCPFGSSASAVNPKYFRYERDSGAFWEDSYGVGVTYPHLADGDDPSDRRLIVGCDDGYIRYWDNSSTNDDGVAIDSYVTFGPFGSQDTELRLSMLQVVLADNQSGAHVQLFASDTPDVIGDPVWAGKLTSGRNPNMFTRVRGSYFWIRLRNASAGERWAFENMTVRVANAGRRRVR